MKVTSCKPPSFGLLWFKQSSCFPLENTDFSSCLITSLSPFSNEPINYLFQRMLMSHQLSSGSFYVTIFKWLRRAAFQVQQAGNNLRIVTNSACIWMKFLLHCSLFLLYGKQLSQIFVLKNTLLHCFSCHDYIALHKHTEKADSRLK